MSNLWLHIMNRIQSLYSPPWRKVTIGAMVAFVGLMLIWWQASLWYQARLLADERGQVAADMESYRNALEININRQFARLEGLRAYVEADPTSENFDLHFDTFAAGLYVDARGIRNFAIAPNATIRYIYPRAGNEPALGHDLLNDPRREVGEAVQRAIDTRHIVLTGPYELLQGGQGLVARQAIFQNDKLWGLVSMALDLPPVLADAGLDSPTNSLSIAMRDQAGKIFYGQQDVFGNNPVYQTVTLPEGEWELAGYPTGGWEAAIQKPLRLFQIIGLAIVALMVSLTYYELTREARLELAVRDRTVDLENEIIERKHIEDTLHESENMFRAIFENSMDAIGVSQFGVHKLVNPAYLTMFGYESASDLTDKPILELIAHSERPRILDFIHRRAQGEPISSFYETRGLHRDGSEFDMEVRISTYLSQGQLFTVPILRNITERKRAEAAMRESEARYRALFEFAPDGILIADPRSYYIDANESICRMLGFTRDELIGRHASDIIDPAEAQFVEPALNAIKSKTGYHREWLFKRKDGSIFTGDVTVTILPDNNLLAVIRDITERKQAQVALRESEERYRLLFEGNPMPMWVYDLETLAFLAVNEAAIFHYGYSRGEFLAMTLKDIRPPEDVPALLENVARSVDGIELAGVWRHCRKDGAVFSVEISSYGLTFAGRRAKLVLANDITERRLAEIALRDSEERYRSIFDGVQDAIFVESLENRILDVNRRACEMFGYSREEFLTKIVPDLVPPGRPIVSFSNGSPGTLSDHPMETVNIRANGESFPVEISGRLQIINGQEAVLVVVRDITARKQAEAALKESEARLTGIISSAMDAIISVNSDQRITLFNAAAEQMFRCTVADALGQPLERFIPERFRVRHRIDVDVFGRRAITRRKMGRIDALTILGQRVDGEEFPAEASISQTEIEGQKVYTVILRDVTERRKAEKEILTLNNELEQRVIERTTQLEAANKELESFSYSVSHDLRAPLRAIDGFSHIILDEYSAQLPKEGIELFEYIRSNTHRMSMLIDDLLEFSRLGRQPLNKQTVHPDKIVQQALESLRHEQEGRKLEMVIGDLPACRGDASLILQIWVNLLSNAFKYTRKRDSARIEVGCQVGVNGEKIYFVRDNGVGFDMRYAGKLFGVFQRLRSDSEFEGTGVGLALVHSIVTRHGGRIWAEAEIDKGATFYFTLGDAK